MIDHIGPFDYYGHSVEGRVRSSNVSTSGEARPANASWYLWIDNEEVAAVCEAQPGDDEAGIRRLLRRAADAFLNPIPERDPSPNPPLIVDPE